MSNLAKLRQDHADLVSIVRQLAAYVGQPSPPPQLELFDLRRRLSSTLIAHLKAEDWVLYPRLAESKIPEVAAIAKAFADEMGGLADAFVSYNDTWSAPAIAADWPGYCADTLGVIDALTSRIARENRELYPLLEEADKAA